MAPRVFLVASAVGPEAVRNLLSGRKAQYPGSLGRFREALERPETDRSAAVRHGDGGALPRGVTPSMQQRASEGGLQSDRELQDLTRPVVERVWTGSVASSPDGASLPAGESAYDAWPQRRALVAWGMDNAETGTALSAQTDALDRSRGSSSVDRDADRGQDWRSDATGSRPAANPPGRFLSRLRRRLRLRRFPLASKTSPWSVPVRTPRSIGTLLPFLPNPISGTCSTTVLASTTPRRWIRLRISVLKRLWVPRWNSRPAQSWARARLLDRDLDAGARVGEGARVRRGYVGPDALVGDGAVVQHAGVQDGARLGAGVVVDTHARVHPGVTVGVDTHVGQRVLLEKGVTVGDRCRLVGIESPADPARSAKDRTQVLETAVLGDGVVVGPGACVSNRANVGPGATLGAGVVVRGHGVVGERARLNPGAVVNVDARVDPGAHVPAGAPVEVTKPGRDPVVVAVVPSSPAPADPSAPAPPSSERPAGSEPLSGVPAADDVLDSVLRAQQAASAAQQRRGAPGAPSSSPADVAPGSSTPSGLDYGPSSTTQTTITVPASALQ